MRIRLIALAVVALIGLTAFAPAPFMKTDRRKDRGDVLDALQGVWSITEKQRMGPNGRLLKMSASQKVRIDKDGWRYVSSFEVNAPMAKGGGKGKGFEGGPAYKIVLDTKRNPVEFRLRRSTARDTDYMVGIVHVSGNTAKILYRLASSARRGEAQEEMPRNFETVPEGWYLMTMQREK